MRRWAVVDLETTGGAPGPDRVTEIAVVLLDGDEETGRFSSLVNPGRGIPPFVRELTGITNAMVKEAPPFSQLAPQIAPLFEDRVMVAHNVPFDYKFLRHEFALCGIPFDPPRLCTVQLARRLFPGHESYSLGKFASAMGWDDFRHHRALGDTLACAEILRMALREHGEAAVEAGIKGEVQPAFLPLGWNAAQVRALPDEPGVLYFHGANSSLLYVDWASSLRVKALHYLSMGRRSPLWSLRQGLVDISWETSGNELLARILAFQEIARCKPSANRPTRLPALGGAPLPECVLVGKGRQPGEQCLLAARGGKAWGYRFLSQDEGMEEGVLWEGFTRFTGLPDVSVLLRQQIQRGGEWKCVNPRALA